MGRKRNEQYKTQIDDYALKEKKITWKRGRPLILCPRSGHESRPDRINIRPGDQLPVAVFECKDPDCKHLFAIEFIFIQGPEGQTFRKGDPPK